MPDADTPGRLWFTGCAPHRGGSSQPWVGWAREDAPYRSPTMPPTQPATPHRPRRPKRQHPVLLLIDDLHVRVIDRHAGRHPDPPRATAAGVETGQGCPETSPPLPPTRPTRTW